MPPDEFILGGLSTNIHAPFVALDGAGRGSVSLKVIGFDAFAPRIRATGAMMHININVPTGNVSQPSTTKVLIIPNTRVRCDVVGVPLMFAQPSIAYEIDAAAIGYQWHLRWSFIAPHFPGGAFLAVAPTVPTIAGNQTVTGF